MNGVMMPSVSAGSSQREASVMCTPHVMVPSGAALAEPTTPTRRGIDRTTPRTHEMERLMGTSQPRGEYTAGLPRAPSAPLRSAVVSHEDGHVGLADSSRGHTEHEIGQLVVGRLEPLAVQAQEDEHRDEPRALVAIDERVILHEVEEVRRRLLIEARVQDLAAKGRCGHRQRRLEESDVTDQRRPPVPCDLVRMERENLVEGEELGNATPRGAGTRRRNACGPLSRSS